MNKNFNVGTLGGQESSLNTHLSVSFDSQSIPSSYNIQKDTLKFIVNEIKMESKYPSTEIDWINSFPNLIVNVNE